MENRMGWLSIGNFIYTWGPFLGKGCMCMHIGIFGLKLIRWKHVCSALTIRPSISPPPIKSSFVKSKQSKCISFSFVIPLNSIFQGRKKECIDAATKAIQLKPNYEKAIIRRAKNCMEVKRYKQALDGCNFLFFHY